MQWSEAQDGQAAILRLSGEIDLQYAPALRKILREKIAAHCPALIIDLSGVEYIDSSGLATFVEYFRDARAFGGTLALAALSNRVNTIFELVRLNELLPVFKTI